MPEPDVANLAVEPCVPRTLRKDAGEDVHASRVPPVERVRSSGLPAARGGPFAVKRQEPEAGEPITRAEFLASLGRRALVVVAAFAVGYSVDWLWARLVRGFDLERERYPQAVLRGWRIHHNVVGYLLVTAGVLWHPFLLIPAGVGMIVGHRRRDRLWWFLERVR